MLDPLLTTGSSLTYLGIIVFLVLTGCGLPIPEEVPIIAAALMSANGLLNPWIALAACLIGAIVGDSVMYGIGYRWGHNLLYVHPKLAKFVHAEREAKYEDMINRHGLKVLFLSRFMVGVRGPVYLSAGMLRIPFRRFLLMDLLCATVVVGTFFGLTFLFGDWVARYIKQAEIAYTVLVVAIVAMVFGFFYFRARRRLARLEAVQSRRQARAQDRQQRKLDRGVA